MLDYIISCAYPVILIIITIFLVYRLKLGKAGGRGKGLIYYGLFLIFISSLLNLLQQQPGYESWFLESIYIIVVVAKFLALVAGAALAVTGLVLYFSFWGDRDAEVSDHLEKLRLLDSIQQESRNPYPMLELVDRILKSVLSGLGEEAGAVFLLDRSQKKFILVSAMALSKEETALLEYYPHARNIVTQAVEEGNPLLSADFRSLGGKAQLAASRFRSILVVPLISGRVKVGAFLVFSTEEGHFSKEFLSIITPICEWLAEKIEVNRLSRDLNRSRRELETRTQQSDRLFGQLSRIIVSEENVPDPTEFARRCIGLAGSDEVRVIGIVDGGLHSYGGAPGDLDFSENYKAALVSALARQKAVILNQEGTDAQGNSFIARSGLLVPVRKQPRAVLFRNNRGGIRIGSEELTALELVAEVAGMVINHSLAASANVSRSKGLDAIAAVLQLQISRDKPEKAVRAFAEDIARAFLPDYLLILFLRDNDCFRAVLSGAQGVSPDGISLAAGEGSTGKSAALRTVTALFDAGSVAAGIAQYNEESRAVMARLFKGKGTPAFQGDYPIVIMDRTEYVISLFGFSVSSDDAREHHRLFSLLAALLNLRMQIVSLEMPAAFPGIEKPVGRLTADDINQVNNELLALLGFCQMGRKNLNTPDATAKAFDSIMTVTEKLAARFKSLLQEKETLPYPAGTAADINECIKESFRKKNISGNLHLIEGRPCSINLNLQDVPVMKAASKSVIDFVDSACRTFTENVDEDEIVTISTYSGKEFLYIDISKHRENFPPVEPVVGFGHYYKPDEIEGPLRTAGFMQFLTAFSGTFAFDRHSRAPSYFSFRFPLSRSGTDQEGGVDVKSLTILAVDDQAVILDLLAAMCQSLGHKIFTAQDGKEGLRMFELHRPDVVISDLVMPGISGWEVAARVKAVSPGTTIILITGWGVPVDERKMKQAGVDYMLQKPFRLEQLSDLISRVRPANIKK
jgi:CheY-like chemotaxis protein